MSELHKLADEIAFLSNNQLAQLAQILVHDYATRADVLETQLGAAFFDSNTIDVNNTGGKW